MPQNSTSYYRNIFLALNPFIGKRFAHKKMNIDFKVGLDIAFWVKNKLYTKFNGNDGDTGGEYEKERTPVMDYRIRMGLCAYYKRVGVDIDYSKGVRNLYRNDFDQSTATTSFIRYYVKYLIK